MATLYPFSQRTARLLEEGPVGISTHLWICKVAAGLYRLTSREQLFRTLRRCCDTLHTHRPFPDREIHSALDFVYNGKADPVRSKSGNFDWFPPNRAALIADQADALFDPTRDNLLPAEKALSKLFLPGELVCTGMVQEKPLVRPLEQCFHDAQWQQFIVPNPMTAKEGINQQGKKSFRCQGNATKNANRRWLVVEFDMADKDAQSRFFGFLSKTAPLVMVVDSGGKSCHGWFDVRQLSAPDQRVFFHLACAIGADTSRWDTSGWLRMPGGTRYPQQIRQRIVYFNEEVALG